MSLNIGTHGPLILNWKFLSLPSLCDNYELNLWISNFSHNLDLKLEKVLELPIFYIFRNNNSRALKITQVFSLCPYVHVDHSYSLKIILWFNSWYSSLGARNVRIMNQDKLEEEWSSRVWSEHQHFSEIKHQWNKMDGNGWI